MSKNLPQIRIQYGWLLHSNLERMYEPKHKSNKKKLSYQQIEKIVEGYQKAWQKYEAKILSGMCKTLGVEFRQNVIDVYIVPGMAAFSEPLVIGVGNKPDEFVDTLTHELFHRLLTDNLSLPYGKMVLAPELEKIIGKDHDDSTFVHIPVHAGLKAIYLDVLKEPARLKRDIGWARDNEKRWGPAYRQAWDYVEEHDYKSINQQLKEAYQRIASKYAAELGQ